MYIEQLLKFKKNNLALYLPIPLLFLGIMALNFIAILLLDLDVNEIIKNEISTKGVNRFFVESMVPFVIGIVFLFLWVHFLHKQSIKSLTTSRPKVDWKRVFFSFSTWALFIIVSTLLLYFNNPENFVLIFNPSKFFGFLILALLLIPIQTSFEEYLFRGYMMQGLGLATMNKIYPLLITSFLFGIMHISNPEVEKMGYFVLIYYIGTGLFLGIITLMDQGIELALGFHAANNLIGALLLTADWSAFQTHSIFKDVSNPTAGTDILFPVFIVYPLLLLLFSKKYQWKNWKQKLIGKIEETQAKF